MKNGQALPNSVGETDGYLWNNQDLEVAEASEAVLKLIPLLPSASLACLVISHAISVASKDTLRLTSISKSA